MPVKDKGKKKCYYLQKKTDMHRKKLENRSPLTGSTDEEISTSPATAVPLWKNRWT